MFHSDIELPEGMGQKTSNSEDEVWWLWVWLKLLLLDSRVRMSLDSHEKGETKVPRVGGVNPSSPQVGIDW